MNAARSRRAGVILVAGLLAVVSVATGARHAGALTAATPEQTGPFAVHVTSVAIPVPRVLVPPVPEGMFTSVIADVYVPAGTGPFPLVQLSHAWPETRSADVGWGAVLASQGVVVIISDRRTQSAVETAPVPLSPADRSQLRTLVDIIDLNVDVNSEDVLRVVRWAIAQDNVRGSVLAGKVDAHHVAIAGHSLGGYYATFAAHRARQEGPQLSALLLLDPTDERLGMTSAPTPLSPIGWSSLHVAWSLRLPTAVLASEENMHPIKCNMSMGPDCTIVSEQEYAALTTVRARFGLRVVGSGHNDAEVADASTRTQHQLLFQRYGIAWLEYWLQENCALSTYLGGPAALADQSAGAITLFSGELLPPCA